MVMERGGEGFVQLFTGGALRKTLIATSVNLRSPLKTGPNPPSLVYSLPYLTVSDRICWLQR